MRLIDTSAWIEWLVGSPAGGQVGSLLPEQSAWLVPTIVQLELVKWLWRELGETHADQVVAFTQLFQVVPLGTRIALGAAEACRIHRLPTVDAIVFATAQAHGADLVTCDRHFERLPRVVLIDRNAG